MSPRTNDQSSKTKSKKDSASPASNNITTRPRKVSSNNTAQIKNGFDDWVAKFTQSISEYDYYVDFKKIYENHQKYKEKYEELKTLIKAKNIRKTFIALMKKNPELLKGLPLLFAVRDPPVTFKGGESFSFDNNDDSKTIKEYADLLDAMGIFDFLQNHLNSDLLDYMLGVEVGLNTHARKNRTGSTMETIVEKQMKKDRLVFEKQVPIKSIEEELGIALPEITNNGKVVKKFDFIIKKRNCTYAVEVDYFNRKGSKLNETARSYIGLDETLSKNEYFKFMWITDGPGWKNSKENLKQAYDKMDYIFCLDDIKQGALKHLKG